MNKDSLGKSVLIGVVWVVFAAFIVFIALTVLSGGCASEKQRAVTRELASATFPAGMTGEPFPVAGPVASPTDKVRAAAYGERIGVEFVSTNPPTELSPPPDTRFLPAKDRLKISEVAAGEAYTVVKEKAAFIQAGLNGDQARFQTSGAFKKYEQQRRDATEKLSALRKGFLEETGITVAEAAAAFEPKRQIGPGK